MKRRIFEPIVFSSFLLTILFSYQNCGQRSALSNDSSLDDIVHTMGDKTAPHNEELVGADYFATPFYELSVSSGAKVVDFETCHIDINTWNKDCVMKKIIQFYRNLQDSGFLIVFEKNCFLGVEKTTVNTNEPILISTTCFNIDNTKYKKSLHLDTCLGVTLNNQIERKAFIHLDSKRIHHKHQRVAYNTEGTKQLELFIQSNEHEFVDACYQTQHLKSESIYINIEVQSL